MHALQEGQSCRGRGGQAGDGQADTESTEGDPRDVPLLGYPHRLPKSQGNPFLPSPQGRQMNDGEARMRNYINSRVGTSGCLESLHGVGVGWG